MQRTIVARRVARGFVVIGTVFALLMAGGAPTDNTNGVARNAMSQGHR